MARGDDFGRELERAIEIATRAAPELLRLPGVVSVGPGPERRAGRPTGRAAIVVTVRTKVSPAQLGEQGIAALPAEIEGLPVDVVELGQPVEPPELTRIIEMAKGVKEQVAQEWLHVNNVTGIGVGYKVRGGKPTGEIAIQIFVKRKVPPDEVARLDSRPVPPVFNGVPTDVLEAGPFVVIVAPSGSRGDRQDPLAGGLSIGHATSPFSYGTLAGIAFDASNSAVGLSNEHVLDGDIGETVHQPSPVGLDDSFEVSLQLDLCNPLNFLRIDTPDTLGGSILAGAAVAAAIAAAASDEVDPTREGQEATPPPGGARTLEEYTKLSIKYPEFPRPGTPFKLAAAWEYERRTDQGTFRDVAERERENPHVLLYHRLFTDQVKYVPDQTIRLYGVLISDDDKPRCHAYHCVALLRPVDLDRSYPVVLRSIRDLGDTGGRILQLFLRRLEAARDEDVELIRKNLNRLCLYYGEFSASGVPVGAWRHWMHVQTVNTVPLGTKPLEAAKIIGGLPVSTHYRANVDIACGPFVFEDDGSFDIELLSI